MLQIILAILGIISALLLARVQSLMSENAKLREELNTEKHKVYVDLASFLREVLDQDFKGDVVAKTRELNGKIIFLASNKVLKAFGDLMQNIYENSNLDSELKKERNGFRSLKLYGELIVAIREDLRIDRKWHRVSWADILRPNINNLNEYLPYRYSLTRKIGTLPYVRYRKHEKLLGKSPK